MYYPDPSHFEPENGRITVHQRSRVVVMQPSHEEAIALAEKLSETIACDVEVFVAITDDAAEVNRGEIVIGRKFFPCKGAMVPVST